MLLTNYHTHSEFCDGQGTPAEMLEQAVALGFSALGFSSHAPLPFDNDFTLPYSRVEDYVETVNGLKDNDQIEVYLGLEIDFIEHVIEPREHSWDSLGLDYKIGSIHALTPATDAHTALCVDGPDDEFNMLLYQVFNGDAKAMVSDYYHKMAVMCEQGGFDILGHYDLIKRHNKAKQFFDESAHWYRNIAISTLDAVARSGVIMEVNYGGMLRGSTDDAYPPLWLLRVARQLNIPVQINADAHHPNHLVIHHEYCRELLLKAGYKTQRVLLDNQWQDIAL